MHRGTLFCWVYVVLAPTVAVGLLSRGVIRAIREPHYRLKILGVAAMAFAMWMLMSVYMFDVVFFTVWSVAHMPPLPDTPFPEGWPIYAWLAGYAALGTALIVALGKVPRSLRRSRRHDALNSLDPG